MSLPNYRRKTISVNSRKALSLHDSLSSSSLKTNILQNSFVFFGCWNNIDCKDNYRDRVLSLLRKLKQNSKIILAGDNWYSQKLGKTKYYLPEVLISGYQELFSISKDVSIVLGNHDINKSKDKYLCEDLGCMLYLQVQAISNTLSNNDSTKLDVSKIKHKSIYRFDKVKLYTCEPKLVKQRNSNVYFLYINTNIFLESVDNINSYIDIIKKQLKNKEIGLLFIVGHHPFFSYKPKKGTTLKDVKELYFEEDKDNIQVIYNFLDIFARYKSIYLCADVHNFQICKLHKNIIMITCGTGGADRDELDINIVNKKITESIEIKTFFNTFKVSNLYVHNSYGFCDISYNKTKVIVKYYQLEDDNLSYTIYNYSISLDSFTISKITSNNNIKLLPSNTFNSSTLKIKQYDICNKVNKNLDKSKDKEETNKILDTMLGTYDGKQCGKKEK